MTSHILRLFAAGLASRRARRVPSPALSLAQGLAGAAVGAVAARAAYALLTLPERVAASGGSAEAGVSTGADGAVGLRAVTVVPAPHSEWPVPVADAGTADHGKAAGQGDAVGGARSPSSSGKPTASMSARGTTDTGDLVSANGPRTWQRSNFRGRTVTLQEGPALASGVCVASLIAPGLAPRVRAATALAAAGAAGFGAYDDLFGDGCSRGLRGHLGALARGRVTTGLVKMVGIAATGIAAASLLRRSPLDTLLDAALIAAGANLVNLFDLRPGRAAKFSLLAAAPALAFSSAPLVGPVMGASAALLPDELAERSMLGDAGANALGAALGAAAAARAPRPVRAALLGGVVALTLASEVTSFSRVIDRVPALRRLDQWGRRE